jgi:HTH-type transcriptional regulator/antitoxin HipB
MEPKELKIYFLHEVKNKYIGKIGTTKRDKYECKLRVEIIYKRIKKESTRTR